MKQVFALVSNSSCTNFELHMFNHSPKNVHLKALLYRLFDLLQCTAVDQVGMYLEHGILIRDLICDQNASSKM